MIGNSLNTFDKYIFIQQSKPFVFFSFVLVGILWLIQSMPRLDDVISNGQSGLVFIKISILIFPQVMLIVLPISAFASTIYAIHKLISESELLIFANAGISNTRLIMPAQTTTNVKITQIFKLVRDFDYYSTKLKLWTLTIL